MAKIMVSDKKLTLNAFRCKVNAPQNLLNDHVL